MIKLVFTCGLLRSALALGVAGSASYVQAGTVVTDAQVESSACVISKQTAIQTALAAVGGGTVILARCEKDASWHWSIDIRSKTHKYGVWVSWANKIVKADIFPLRPNS